MEFYCCSPDCLNQLFVVETFKRIQKNEWNATSVSLFRVILSSAAEAVDSDDKEEYSEAEGSCYD